jgi:flavodoxin
MTLMWNALKTLIIYVSYHHNNTEKVAKTIADTMGADLRKLQQTQPESLSEFDLVGFGSGIYYGKHDKTMLNFSDNLPRINGKKAFIFSTSGVTGKKASKFHKQLKTNLTAKGYEVIGEFNCPGFDTFGALRLIGGISKGRPNDEDLKQAETFAMNIKEKTNTLN